MDEPGVIYFIWNMINGKRYVGQTTNSLKKRMAQHKSGNLVVDKAIQKYGIKNFRYGVIKSCASREELNCWEKYFIAALKTKHPYGYNFTDGGDCNFTVSDESRAKMSAKRKGVQKSPNIERKSKLLSAAKIIISLVSIIRRKHAQKFLRRKAAKIIISLASITRMNHARKCL